MNRTNLAEAAYVTEALSAPIASIPVFVVREQPGEDLGEFRGLDVALYNRIMALPIEERYGVLDSETKLFLGHYSLLRSFGNLYREQLEELRPYFAAIGKACLDTSMQERGGTIDDMFPLGDIRNFRPVIARRGGNISACLEEGYREPPPL